MLFLSQIDVERFDFSKIYIHISDMHSACCVFPPYTVSSQQIFRLDGKQHIPGVRSISTLSRGLPIISIIFHLIHIILILPLRTSILTTGVSPKSRNEHHNIVRQAQNSYAGGCNIRIPSNPSLWIHSAGFAGEVLSSCSWYLGASSLFLSS